MKSIYYGAVSLGIALLITQSVLSQTITNLQFTGVSATDEGNILLTWTSVSNEVYQIQEADSLIDTNTGATTWNLLYDQYPSQGTNTFWLDTGNYNLNPQILNPKQMPIRFYRILDEGQDTLAGDEPTVTIGSLTNNSLVTGEITFTVTEATDQPGIRGTTLYVDGQEMNGPIGETNFTVGSTNYETDTYSINTCEWLDGTHLIFATAQASSQYTAQINGSAVLNGHGVSPFVPLVFSNLIEEISFSQPSFDPTLGETQIVSAVFAANCDWTLQIQNVATSNTVLTATGSGTSMSYPWDGTGTGETNLPPGIYYYYISAETNGESDDVEEGGSGGGGSPPSPDAMFDVSELWAVAPDSDEAVPFFLYPPGFDTNGFTIFSATPSEIASLYPVTAPGGGSFTPDAGGAGGGGSGASGQDSPATPTRPPTNPIRGIVGTLGVAADTYSADGTNGVGCPPISNGLLPTLYVSLYSDEYPDGSTGSGHLLPLPTKDEVNELVKSMQYYGWSNPLNEIDNQLSIGQLEGSGSPFNNVTLGVVMLHGTYGIGSSATDYTASNCKQMYFGITSGGGAQLLRFSQMKLGGPTITNGLKWMVIDACFSLQQGNWASMQSHLVKPYNSNLHMILGADTEMYTSNLKWYDFSQYVNWGKRVYGPYTIRNAYYQANIDAFANAPLPDGAEITLAVANDTACFGDTLQTNSPPGGSWQWGSQPVYP